MHPNHGHQGHNPPTEQQNGYSNHPPNGHNHNAPSQNPSHRNPSQQLPREPIRVDGIPSVTVENNNLVVGDSDSSSVRMYTPLKVVGDGSFGTVWLCDWHGTLPPNTPLSAMQCSSGARPEYAGKRLVAVKRMKKRWEGGWDECKRLKELESLRAIPYHPNIIPLYDFFLLPSTKELYFVFESMEGNLYQLIKSRKGKPLAGGLVSSIFRQVVEGLHHIHASGYFHRDMKPENLLVTTTGLYDYRPVVPAPNASPDKDVVVIIKLADFGLARETRSLPPYTEYVSTRWYRAPEVLLKSHDYSNPVDMWALGTIMAEVVNLRPLFPGQGEIDQVARICELLGDPVEDYGKDDRKRPIGGGQWPRGVQLARKVGFEFSKMRPQDIYTLFDRNVPVSLVECIADLLKYDPDLRLTSEDCLHHRYLLETAPLNNPPGAPTSPQAPCKSQQQQRSYPDGASPNPSLRSVAPRSIPPSHSHPGGHPKVHPAPMPRGFPQIPDASSSHRSSFYDSGYHSVTRQRSISEVSQPASDYSGDIIYSPRSSEAGHAEARRAALVRSPEGAAAYPHGPSRITNVNNWVAEEQAHRERDWDAMDVSPQLETPAEAPYVTVHQPMDIQTSPIVPEYPARPAHEPEPPSAQSQSHGQGSKFSKLGSLGFGKKHAKWGLGMFGHGEKHNALPPVQENGISSITTVPSLKRRESSSTDSRSLPEITGNAELSRAPNEDAKQRKKEQERMAKEVQKEAERQRRIRAEKMQREQARAVMKNNRRLAQAVPNTSIEWLGGAHGNDFARQPASTGPIRQPPNYGTSSLTVNAAGGSFKGSAPSPVVPTPQDSEMARAEWRRDYERYPKARRREYDDDHSMSSDVRSSMSVLSFATVDSDPGPNGPGHMRHRQSAYGMNRMTSMSSIRGSSSIEDCTTSPGRSSTSLSLEQKFMNEFHLRPSVDSSSLSEHGSPQPPPMQMLSLSSPIPWQHSHSDLSSSSTVDNSGLRSPRRSPRHLSSPLSSPLSPPPQPRQPGPLHLGPSSPYGTSAVYGPPSPGLAPKSAINPMFKVPSFSGSVDRPSITLTSLPPFSQLEAVADGGEYPPLSPMSFTIPEEEVSGEDS